MVKAPRPHEQRDKGTWSEGSHPWVCFRENGMVSFPYCRNRAERVPVLVPTSPTNDRYFITLFHHYSMTEQPISCWGGNIMFVCVCEDRRMAPFLTITGWFNDRHSDKGNIHHPRGTHFHWSIWLGRREREREQQQQVLCSLYGVRASMPWNILGVCNRWGTRSPCSWYFLPQRSDILWNIQIDPGSRSLFHVIYIYICILIN